MIEVWVFRQEEGWILYDIWQQCDIERVIHVMNGAVAYHNNEADVFITHSPA